MTKWDWVCLIVLLWIDLACLAIFRDPGDAPLIGFIKLDAAFAVIVWLPVKALGGIFRRGF